MTIDLGAVIDGMARNGAAFAAAALLLGVAAAGHFAALERMEKRDAFVQTTSRTEHNMALIEFVDDHPGYAAGYAALFAAVLAFVSVRRHPAWTVWLGFAFLAAPPLVYACICFSINGKLVAP